MSIHETLGSRVAALLFSCLEYRFSKYPSGFYKFISPSGNNIFYRPGDSLSEELKVDRKTIQRALKVLCTSYRSKASYFAAKEALGEIGAFQGKPYLSYHDNRTGQTFYLREYRVVNSVINGSYKIDLYVTKCPMLQETFLSHAARDILSHAARDILSHADPLKAAENNCETSPSEKTIHRIPLSLPFSLSNDNHSESEQPKEEEIKNKFINTKQPSVSLSIIDELVERWKSITDRDLSAPLRTQTVKNLSYSFHEIFGGCDKMAVILPVVKR